jgi:hypothetical protein
MISILCTLPVVAGLQAVVALVCVLFGNELVVQSYGF